MTEIYWRVTPIEPRRHGMLGFSLPGTHGEAMRQATDWARAIGARVRVTFWGRA